MSLFNKTYKIKNIDGNILFKSNKVSSLKECIELAVKKKVSLEEADLRGANLCKANLEGADLRGAYCPNANLEGANLKNTNFNTTIIRTSLKGANLKEANFEGANLEEVYLKGANLKGADFTDAIFSSDEIKNDCIQKSKGEKETDSEKIKNAQAMIKAAMANKQK